MVTEPPLDMDQLLGGLHEWRDVQGVVRTTFQALYDVAHAQSDAVREVERRLGEVQGEFTSAVGRKADASELRQALAAASDARAAADLVAQRVEEEAQCALEAQRAAASETQALRAGLSDLRAAVEKQRADVQQWRAGFETGLTHLVAECSGAAQAVQAECKAALQQEVERLEQEVGRLSSALEEKATAGQLREIVREAWQREESHLARLQRLCDSKAARRKMFARTATVLLAAFVLDSVVAWDERDDAYFEDSALGELLAADDLAAQFGLSEPDLDGSEALSLLQVTALLQHKERRESAVAGHGLGPRDVGSTSDLAAGDEGRRAAVLAEADDLPSAGVALVQTEAKIRPAKLAKLGKSGEL